MSGVLDRLKKKRAFPVVIGDEPFYVRSLTIGELKKVSSLTDEEKTPFLIGCTLCADEAGAPAIEPVPNESPSEFAARAMTALADVESETIRALSEGVASLSKTPSATAVAKNS